MPCPVKESFLFLVTLPLSFEEKEKRVSLSDVHINLFNFRIFLIE